MPEQFAIGEVYFRVTYPGSSLNYPLIESFVYVGKNLSDEDTEDTWYFQCAESYARSGPIVGTQGRDRRVVCVNQDEHHEMLNEDQLAEKLKAARERRHKK